MEKIKLEQLQEKLDKNTYVLLDFNSPGCSPCKKAGAVINEFMEEENNIDLGAYEINIAEDRAAALKFSVMSVPTIILFKDGKEVKRLNSLNKKSQLEKLF